MLHKNTIEDICYVLYTTGTALVLVHMDFSALRDAFSVTCNIILRDRDVMIALGKLCVRADFRVFMRIT